MEINVLDKSTLDRINTLEKGKRIILTKSFVSNKEYLKALNHEIKHNYPDLGISLWSFLGGEWSDISFLGMLPDIRNLLIIDEELEDISMLANLKQLETLILKIGGESLDLLSCLHNLKNLDITGNYSNLNFINKIDSLKSLSIKHNFDLKSLQFLYETNLESLEIIECKNLNDFHPIEKNSDLYYLKICFQPKLHNINLIGDLKKLKLLYIEEVYPIENFSWLRNLSILEELVIENSNNLKSHKDFLFLEDLLNLEKLHIRFSNRQEHQKFVDVMESRVDKIW